MPTILQGKQGGKAGGVARHRLIAAGAKLSGGAQSIEPLSADEWEFAQAMRQYSDATHHQFPTYSECLHVLRGLGYHK